jgi:hypothetical protein
MSNEVNTGCILKESVTECCGLKRAVLPIMIYINLKVPYYIISLIFHVFSFRNSRQDSISLFWSNHTLSTFIDGDGFPGPLKLATREPLAKLRNIMQVRIKHEAVWWCLCGTWKSFRMNVPFPSSWLGFQPLAIFRSATSIPRRGTGKQE